jgi:ABC-type siderophore export system fused ATPase/permease subunit
LRGYYISSLFFFLALEWQLRSPNGSHICCRLHRFVVCLTIFFLFFPTFCSFIFLFICSFSYLCIYLTQTNK